MTEQLDADDARELLTWRELLEEARRAKPQSWPLDPAQDARIEQIGAQRNWELVRVYDTGCCKDCLPPECPRGYCCHTREWNFTPTAWPSCERWFVKPEKEWT